jgi:hypothetical protein
MKLYKRELIFLFIVYFVYPRYSFTPFTPFTLQKVNDGKRRVNAADIDNMCQPCIFPGKSKRGKRFYAKCHLTMFW